MKELEDTHELLPQLLDKVFDFKWVIRGGVEVPKKAKIMKDQDNDGIRCAKDEKR